MAKPHSHSSPEARKVSTAQKSEPPIAEPVLNTIAPETDVDPKQHAINQICKVYETFGQALQMMCSLDHSFAVRLAACRTVGEATLLCSEWMAHRVDSLFAVQSQLTEIWIQYANAAIVRNFVEQQGSKITSL